VPRDDEQHARLLQVLSCVPQLARVQAMRGLFRDAALHTEVGAAALALMRGRNVKIKMNGRW
jgi:hypothetical protein